MLPKVPMSGHVRMDKVRLPNARFIGFKKTPIVTNRAEVVSLVASAIYKHIIPFLERKTILFFIKKSLTNPNRQGGVNFPHINCANKYIITM